MQYNQVLNDTIIAVLLHQGSAIGLPDYDSVRINFNMQYLTKVDAEGIIQLPNAVFNTLRANVITITTGRVEGKNGTGPYTLLPDYNADDTTHDFYWYAKDFGFYVANYNKEGNTMTYCKSRVVSGLENMVKNMNVKISNPISSGISISNEENKPIDISLYNVLGTFIITYKVGENSSNTFDVSSLPNGLYFAQIRRANENSFTIYKLLK